MTEMILGAFALDAEGQLAPADALTRPSLRFAWRGRLCQAELDNDEVRMATIAARIPSTAEPGADRRGALAGLAGMPGALPEGWRMQLLPDHRIRLETTAPLGSPPTAVRLVAEMVRFALALDPYLDRLEAVGATAPAAGAEGAEGRANT